MLKYLFTISMISLASLSCSTYSKKNDTVSKIIGVYQKYQKIIETGNIHKDYMSICSERLSNSINQKTPNPSNSDLGWYLHSEL